MSLYFIGLGLKDVKDLTIRGLDAVKKCDVVYFESYTSCFGTKAEELEGFFGKRVIPAGRQLVEESDEIIKNARQRDVAFLVIGDPLVATTHTDLWLRAKKENIRCEIIHNSSVFSAVAETGLQLYKFGKTSSIPFHDKSFEPENFYDAVKENMKIGAHTLLLLDLKPEQKKFMTVEEAIRMLLAVEKKRKENVFREETACVGCARLGADSAIRFGKAKDVAKENFGSPPYCLVVPSRLHFVEEEALNNYLIK